MSESMLGSSFEMSLRILLMLSAIPNARLDEVQIASIDFIAVYGADFGLLDENLHGYGSYRFSEYPARRELVTAALRELVLDGLVLMDASTEGYRFFITNQGRNFCEKLTSIYADEYTIAVNAVRESYDINDSSSMVKAINDHATESLEETMYG